MYDKRSSTISSRGPALYWWVVLGCALVLMLTSIGQTWAAGEAVGQTDQQKWQQVGQPQYGQGQPPVTSTSKLKGDGGVTRAQNPANDPSQIINFPNVFPGVTPWLKSISLLSFHPGDFGSITVSKVLRQIADDHADMVQFVVNIYQHDCGSPHTGDTGPIFQLGTESPTDASLLQGIKNAQSYGLRVGINLHPEISVGGWRDCIEGGSDRNRWYSEYTGWLTKYAQMLNANPSSNGKNLLVMGTELGGVSRDSRKPDNTTRWRTMIQTVRTSCPASICLFNYTANHDGEEDEIKFWDEPGLDLIGVSPYYYVSGNATPSVQETRDIWHNHDDQFRNLVARYNKPFIFMELGFRSRNRAGDQPYRFDCITGYIATDRDEDGHLCTDTSNNFRWLTNEQAQSNLMRGTFEYAASVTFVNGVSLWNYYPYLSAGGPDDNDFTPQNKLAEQTIALAWGGTFNPAYYSKAVGAFHALPPFRLYDSRTSQGGTGPFAAGETRTISVTTNRGPAGTSSTVPVPVGTKAVVANFTAVNVSKGGFLTAYQTGIAQPTISSLNFYLAGQNVANTAVVNLDDQGQMNVYMGAASGEVVIDVVGYIDDTYAGVRIPASNPLSGVITTAALNYHPIPSTTSSLRAYDSRGGAGPLLSGQSRTVQITGQAGVPAGTKAVAVNLTAIGGVNAGFLAAYPGTTNPGTAAVQFNASQQATVGNMVIVALDSAGAMTVLAGGGGASANFTVDVMGYYDTVLGNGKYTPLSPVRLYDSRTSQGGSGPLVGAGSVYNLPVSTKPGTTTPTGVPVTATAVIVHLTTVNTVGGGYMSLYGVNWQGQASINWSGNGVIASNTAIVSLERLNSLKVLLGGGATVQSEFVLDILGYIP